MSKRGNICPVQSSSIVTLSGILWAFGIEKDMPKKLDWFVIELRIFTHSVEYVFYTWYNLESNYRVSYKLWEKNYNNSDWCNSFLGMEGNRNTRWKAIEIPKWTTTRKSLSRGKLLKRNLWVIVLYANNKGEECIFGRRKKYGINWVVWTVIYSFLIFRVRNGMWEHIWT